MMLAYFRGEGLQSGLTIRLVVSGRNYHAQKHQTDQSEEMTPFLAGIASGAARFGQLA